MLYGLTTYLNINREELLSLPLMTCNMSETLCGDMVEGGGKEGEVHCLHLVKGSGNPNARRANLIAPGLSDAEHRDLLQEAMPDMN